MTEVDDSATKACKKCGKDKPLTCYYKAKGCVDGRRGECIVCSKDWQRTQRDKDAKAESDRRYREEQGEALLEKKRAYRAANEEKARATVRECFDRNRSKYYEAQMRKKYGIGEDDYQRMLSEQEYVCAICRKPETAMHRRGDVVKVKRLAIDHCHATGVVRALLCQHCNQGIGHFRDEPDALRAAADYIEAHR